MKLPEHIEWKAREEAARMTDEQLANLLSEHAYWYEEYIADAYDDGDEDLTYQLALESAALYAASVRLLKKAHADKQKP